MEKGAELERVCGFEWESPTAGPKFDQLDFGREKGAQGPDLDDVLFCGSEIGGGAD